MVPTRVELRKSMQNVWQFIPKARCYETTCACAGLCWCVLPVLRSDVPKQWRRDIQKPSVVTRPCWRPLGCGHTKVINAVFRGGAGATELSKTMPEPYEQQPGSVQGPLRTRVARPEGPDLSVRESFAKENVKSGDVATRFVSF